MSESKTKSLKFKEITLKPVPEIVKFLEEMLALAQTGKLRSLIQVAQIDGQGLEQFSFVMDKDARLHFEYVGQLEMMKLQLLTFLMGQIE